MTLVSVAIILSFTIMEFFDYRRIDIDTSVVVDRSRGEKLTVHLNVTFPRVPCYRETTVLSVPARSIQTDDRLCPVMSLDLMDISGELQRDISHDVIKTRLSAAGTAVPGVPIAELSSDIDKMDKTHPPEYCGSCFGGEPPESGCCNTCDEVREAYTRKGWSFGNPGGIDQVRISLFYFPLSSSRADS